MRTSSFFLLVTPDPTRGARRAGLRMGIAFAIAAATAYALIEMPAAAPSPQTTHVPTEVGTR
jgi:hypothetical protein